jgi:hypothetical protein
MEMCYQLHAMGEDLLVPISCAEWELVWRMEKSQPTWETNSLTDWSIPAPVTINIKVKNKLK